MTLREFDLGQGAFVEDGFSLPSGKQEVAWLDADTLLLAREWQPGEMTRSGYAFVVKRVKRGQPLAAAVEVYRGSVADVGVSPVSLSDGSGHSAVFIQRAVSIFEFEFFILGSKGPEKLALPMKSELLALLDGRLIVSLHEDWKRAGQATLPKDRWCRSSSKRCRPIRSIYSLLCCTRAPQRGIRRGGRHTRTLAGSYSRQRQWPRLFLQPGTGQSLVTAST